MGPFGPDGNPVLTAARSNVANGAMLTEFLHDQAALFAAGALPAAEREAFEVMLEYRTELRAPVAKMQEALALAALAGPIREVVPPAALRNRILESAGKIPPGIGEPEALVVTGPGGLIEWVNPAFTAMCGYSPEELRDRKPGALLQGPETDSAAVERIRVALRAAQPCRETLVNYHKDGSRYRVDLRIMPILDDARQPLWFVARERKLHPEGVAA